MRGSWSKKIKRAAWMCGVACVLLLAYGVVVERFFVLDFRPPVVAEVPDLPAAWREKRIGVIADIHTGMWLGNERMARRAVSELIAARPDLVLIAGDLVVRASGHRDRVERAVEVVRPFVTAKIPTFAVLGNHDYSIFARGDTADNELAERIVSALREAGIIVLRNESRKLQRAGEPPLWLVGIDSNWAERDDPAVAFAELPPGAPRIVFMHNPASFLLIPAAFAPFAVAAHTHGGGIRMPRLPQWSWLRWVQPQTLPADGWATTDFGQQGNRLFVNRGVGNSTLPIRINNPPVVNLFTLEAR